MTLMRFDPFRELDRLAEQTLAAGSRAVRTMPMEALRRGDQFIVCVDLPGVESDDVDLTVERNVVSIRARRAPVHREGDEVMIDERPYGEFTRQLFLGDNLDPDRLSAETRNGVLILTIPVSEASKPRRVQLSTSSEGAADRSGDSREGGGSPARSTAGAGAGSG